MGYLFASLKREGLPEFLNRYFHIHVQTIILFFTRDALQASRLLNILTITATFVVIYIFGRILYGHVIPAILAIGFIFGQSAIMLYIGTSWADFTVMLMILVCILIAVLYNQTHKRIWLLAFGCLAYLAFRSKEMAVTLIAVAPLLFDTSLKPFDKKRFFKTTRYLLGGALIGVTLMSIFDTLFLWDPLFSLRPESWQSLFDANLRSRVRGPGSLIDALLGSSSFYIPAILYLFYGPALFRSEKKRGRLERVLWMFPIIYMVIVTVFLSFTQHGFHLRYTFGIYPLIGILAGGAIWHKISPWLDRFEGKRYWATSNGLIVIPILLTPLLARAAEKIGEMNEWEFSSFNANIYLPLLILLLSLLWLSENEWAGLYALAGLTLYAGILFPPMFNTFDALDTDNIRTYTYRRFVPFQEIEDEVVCDLTNTFFVSQDLAEALVTKDLQFLRRVPNHLSAVFTCPIATESVTVSDSVNPAENTTYIFITPEEWGESPQIANLQHYDVFVLDKLVFLKLVP